MAKQHSRRPVQNYKPRAQSRGASRITSSLLWLTTGVIIGFAIATYTFFKLPTATQRLQSVIEKPLTSNQAAKKTTASDKKVAAAKPQPRYDFYDILPNAEVPASKTANSKPAAQPKPAAAEKPATPGNQTADNLPKPNTASDINDLATHRIKTESQEKAPTKDNAHYALQLGSFSQYQEADQLRAELVLLGFDTNIKNSLRKGARIYQVWLGPFATVAEANSMQQRLVKNRVKSALIKVSSDDT